MQSAPNGAGCVAPWQVLVLFIYMIFLDVELPICACMFTARYQFTAKYVAVENR